MRFLVDEDLPRTMATALVADGHDALDSRDAGLRAKPDEEIFAFAQRDDRVLLTMDLDFADEHRFPLGGHRGIIIARIPTDVRKPLLVQLIARAIATLTAEDVVGNVIIVEPTQLRIRRHTPVQDDG